MDAATVRPCSRSDVARRSDSRSDAAGGVGATTIVSVGRAPVDRSLRRLARGRAFDRCRDHDAGPVPLGHARCRMPRRGLGGRPSRTSVPPTSADPFGGGCSPIRDSRSITGSSRSRSGPRDSSPWLAPRREQHRGARHEQQTNQSDCHEDDGHVRCVATAEASRRATSNASGAPFLASWAGSCELAAGSPTLVFGTRRRRGRATARSNARPAGPGSSSLFSCASARSTSSIDSKIGSSNVACASSKPELRRRLLSHQHRPQQAANLNHERIAAGLPREQVNFALVGDLDGARVEQNRRVRRVISQVQADLTDHRHRLAPVEAAAPFDELDERHWGRAGGRAARQPPASAVEPGTP